MVKVNAIKELKSKTLEVIDMMKERLEDFDESVKKWNKSIRKDSWKKA